MKIGNIPDHYIIYRTLQEAAKTSKRISQDKQKRIPLRDISNMSPDEFAKAIHSRRKSPVKVLEEKPLLEIKNDEKINLSSEGNYSQLSE